MEQSMYARRRSVAQVLAVLFVLTATLHPGTGTLGAAQGSGRNAVDFGAITLTPADLEAAGLEGYRVNYGYVTYPDEVAAFVADSRDLPETEVRETLEDAGFAYWYETSQYVPLDADDPQGPVARQVSSYVLEFEDEDGAEAGWELLEDESFDETARDLRQVADFGDQSEATRYRASDPVTGDMYDALDLSIRLGAFHVGVRVTDWVGEELELADAEALAEVLQERVETVLDGAGPGLSTQAVRLTGEEIVSTLDTYSLLTRKAVYLYSESTRGSVRRQNDAAELDQTDVYVVWQHAPGGEGVEDDIWYSVDLMHFADEDAADAWLDGIRQRIENNTNFTDFEVDTGAPQLGDASIAYTAKWAESPIFYRTAALRVGTTVAVVEIQGPERVPSIAVEDVAEAQADCLEDGACDLPVAAPEELEEFISDVQSVDQDEDNRDITPEADETPEPDAADEETPADPDTSEADETPEPGDI